MLHRKALPATRVSATATARSWKDFLVARLQQRPEQGHGATFVRVGLVQQMPIVKAVGILPGLGREQTSLGRRPPVASPGVG